MVERNTTIQRQIGFRPSDVSGPIAEGQSSSSGSGTTRAPTRQGRSTEAEDRYELEMFKRVIDLSAYASSRGYRLDRRESSPRTRVMRLGDDKINISRAPDGHWLFYSFRDLQDNGSIIEFVLRRDHPHATPGHYPLGRVRQELRRWTHTERELPEFARVPLQPVAKNLALVEENIARAKFSDSHPYLEFRGLTATTLAHPRFRGAWCVATGYHRDGRWQPLFGDRGNLLFPHHNEHGLCGYEAKNRAFTGFAPGGEKALWTSRVRTTDNVLVVAESAIDALSYHELNPNPKARYISFAGQMNPTQPALLERAVTWMPAGATVVAATDNDKDGHSYAERIARICEHHPSVHFVRHTPHPGRGKDWNDQLRELRSRSRMSGLPQGLER
jgi:hypothetical protein